MRVRVCVLTVGLMLWCQSAWSAGEDLYDETVLRTIKLQFSQSNWASLLTTNKSNDDQNGTQTDIPATLTVDDAVYPGVGVRYRGHAASYQMISNSPKPAIPVPA